MLKEQCYLHQLIAMCLLSRQPHSHRVLSATIHSLKYFRAKPSESTSMQSGPLISEFQSYTNNVWLSKSSPSQPTPQLNTNIKTTSYVGGQIEQILEANLDHPSQALLQLHILWPLHLCHIRHLHATKPSGESQTEAEATLTKERSHAAVHAPRDKSHTN